MRKKWACGGGALLVGMVLAAVGWAASVGDPLPPFQLADVENGQVVDVGAMAGSGVLAVTYMQTSCAACRKELLALKDLAARYPKLRVVAISVDSGSPARVKRYKEHFGFDFPFLHDPEFKTPELFGFSFTPALVLVGSDGKIALLKGGYRPGDENELEAKLQELLK
ncbi:MULTISPECIES: TlpA family protein disulfide reductase [Deferrisoma]